MSMAALLSPSPSTFLALTSHPPTIAVLLTFLSGISHCSLSLKSLIQCGALGNAQLVMVRCMQGDPLVPLINFGDKSSFMWEKLQKYFCASHSLISGTSSVQVRGGPQAGIQMPVADVLSHQYWGQSAADRTAPRPGSGGGAVWSINFSAI